MEFHNKLGKVLLSELPKGGHSYAPLLHEADNRKLLPSDGLELPA